MARAALATAAVLAALAIACGGADGPEAPPDASIAPAPATTTATATMTTAPATAMAAPATATAAPATATAAPATATAPPATQAPEPRADPDLEIVTLLPPDAIPAIDDPAIVSAAAADEQLRANDLVIGVSLGGEHRAYGAAFLSGHEIVNDMLGGRAIAVTW